MPIEYGRNEQLDIRIFLQHRPCLDQDAEASVDEMLEIGPAGDTHHEDEQLVEVLLWWDRRCRRNDHVVVGTVCTLAVLIEAIIRDTIVIPCCDNR